MRPLARALGCGLLSTVGLAGCAAGSGSPDGGGRLDLAPPEVTGTVAGAPLRFDRAVVAEDAACGPRGLRITLSSSQAPRPDAGPGLVLDLHLSDRIPGVYLPYDPITCQASPGGKGLYAALYLPAREGVASGFVLLGGWDGTTATGSIDLSFAAAPDARPEGRLTGNFVAPSAP